LSVDAIVGYGYDWIKVSRKAGPAVAPVTPKAKPQGELCDALLGVEYIFENRKYEAMPRNFLVTPFFNLQYIWTKVDGFKEQGGGVNDLRVSRQLAKSLKTTLATRLEYILAYENFTFNPELDLGWQYEFLDKKRGVNFSTPNLAQVQSISASVVGAGRNTFLLGVDFFFTICKVFELELMYDLQWNSVYVNNNFYIGIGGNF
jgi:outer membrane autotransporter protein